MSLGEKVRLKNTIFKAVLLSGALLLLSGQAPPSPKPAIKVYSAMIPMIDAHLESLGAVSKPSSDSKAEIELNLVREPKIVENVGSLEDERVIEFYRSALANTYFEQTRVPKPKSSPYVSKFQLACSATLTRYDARADSWAICREDLWIQGTLPLPPPEYPLKIQFEFADNAIISVNLITANPVVLAQAERVRAKVRATN